MSTTNEQRQQLIEEAAQRLAEALGESYWMTADPVSAQQLQVELTQNFCKAMMEKLRRQTESNETTTERGLQEDEHPGQRMEYRLEDMQRHLEELERSIESAKAASQGAQSEESTEDKP